MFQFHSQVMLGPFSQQISGISVLNPENSQKHKCQKCILYNSVNI